jgi:hypothetical protein
MTKIYVGIDDQVIEATGDILKEIKQNQADYLIKKANEEAEENAKATAKATLLERLGITAEEAVLLLP